MKRLIVVLLLLLLLTACEQDKQAGELVGQNPPPPPDTGYLAQVGNNFITAQDLANELVGMPEHRRVRYTTPEGKDQLLEQMIKREMFHQEAVLAGLDQSEEYRLRVHNLSRLALVEMFLEERIKAKVTVSDQEISDYYEKHRESQFTNPVSREAVPLAGIKENIRNFLLMEKQRELFDRHMEELIDRYVVRLAQKPGAGESAQQAPQGPAPKAGESAGEAPKTAQ